MSINRAMHRPKWVRLVLGVMAVSSLSLAAGKLGHERKAPEATKDIMAMDYQKSMNTDDAMPTGMARPNMVKGDVRAYAEKKAPKMRKIMQEEIK
ncbi:MAG: hypothetical protein ACLPXB_13725 [Thiobacillaceae bacterium]